MKPRMLFLLIAWSLGGCSLMFGSGELFEKVEAPPQGEAALYVYRVLDGVCGSIGAVPFEVNGKWASDLYGDSYARLELPPATYVVSVPSVGTVHFNRLRLHLQAQQTRFVQIFLPCPDLILGTTPKIFETTEVQALSEMQDDRLQPSASSFPRKAPENEGLETANQWGLGAGLELLFLLQSFR